MRLLSRLTIGKKCLGLSVVSSLLLLAVAGTGLWGIHSISASAERMLQGEANVAEHAAAARGDVLELRRFEKDTFLNCLDPKKVNEYTEKFNDAHASLAKHIDTLEELAGTAEDKQRILATRNDLKIYASAMATIFAEVKSGDIKAPQDGNRAVSAYKDAIHHLEKAVAELAQETPPFHELRPVITTGADVMDQIFV